MNIEDIDIEFLFNINSPNLLRDIDISLLVADGTSVQMVASKYNLSTTRIRQCHYKVCRKIATSLFNKNILDESFMKRLFEINFISEDGLILIYKYKKYVEDKLKENNYENKNFFDGKYFQIYQVIESNINNIIEMADKKRIRRIEIAQKEFLVLRKKLLELLNKCKEL